MKTALRLLARLIAAVSIAAAAMMALAQPAVVTTFADGPGEGTYAFATWTPKTLGDLMQGNRSGESVNITGRLFLPPGQDKAPAVVLVHGSGGTYPALFEFWPKVFGSAGMATFVLDMFAPRGVASTAEDQSQVPFSADVADVFAALKLVATHPRIDRERIAIMGFSRGGTATLRAAVNRLANSQKLPDGLRYAAFIPAYAGGCLGGFRLIARPGVFGKAPILFIHGTADDYTAIEPCKDYADKIRAAGTPVEFAAIEGAHHKFDADDTKRHWLARATKTKPDCPIEIDIENFFAYDRTNGSRLQGEAYNAMLKSCATTGATVEGNARARDQAAAAAVAFLRRTLAK
jgi:dienelactone hydrolase